MGCLPAEASAAGRGIIVAEMSFVEPLPSNCSGIEIQIAKLKEDSFKNIFFKFNGACGWGSNEDRFCTMAPTPTPTSRL
jgi:hypothetical protein